MNSCASWRHLIRTGNSSSDTYMHLHWSPAEPVTCAPLIFGKTFINAFACSHVKPLFLRSMLSPGSSAEHPLESLEPPQLTNSSKPKQTDAKIGKTLLPTPVVFILATLFDFLKAVAHATSPRSQRPLDKSDRTVDRPTRCRCASLGRHWGTPRLGTQSSFPWGSL